VAEVHWNLFINPNGTPATEPYNSGAEAMAPEQSAALRRIAEAAVAAVIEARQRAVDRT
jgi:hypothetical protein